MANLTGKKIKDTYDGLLKTIDNLPLTESVEISDGNGNPTGIIISPNGTISINRLGIDALPLFNPALDFQIGNSQNAKDGKIIANLKLGSNSLNTLFQVYGRTIFQNGTVEFKLAPTFNAQQKFPSGVSTGHNNNVLGSSSLISGVGLKSKGEFSIVLGRYNDETINYVDGEVTILQIGGGGDVNRKHNVLTIVRTSLGSQEFNYQLVMEWLATQSPFANDSQASAGGVPIGGLYRTGSNVKIRVN